MNLEIELPDLEQAEEEIDTRRGLKKYVQILADWLFGSLARTAGTVILLAGCYGLIAWNVSRLSILDELVVLEARGAELDDQLRVLERGLAGFDMDRLAAEIQAENARVFQGFPELAAWAEGLARIAERDGMAFAYTVQPAHLSPVPGVLEVPLNIELKATDEMADKLFTSATTLLGRVLRDHWHIDVVSTQAEGEGAGLTSMSVNAQVWVKDRYGFVDLATLAGGSAEADEEDDAEFFD